MSLSLEIYHRLPALPKSVVASARGYQLRSWRYGKETEKLVETILERDSWTPENWRSWREERLARILDRAARRVPYYREYWRERRRKGDNATWERLENWPVLEKSTLRHRNSEFVADDQNPRRMFHDHTSGTTGTAVNLWASTDTVRLWYAMFEARGRRWYGVSRKDRWAIFGGQLVTAASRKRPPFWVWNAGLKQLYLSSYHLRPDFAAHYVRAMAANKVRYILAYPSAVYSLAQHASREDCRSLSLNVIVTNAEPLLAHQRTAIEEAFGCAVRETYGMAETVAAASECDSGRLHMWPDTGIVEYSDDGPPGDLICTGLINTDMPLIRYRVGDCGQPVEGSCTCGKTLSLFGGIEGRSDDVLFTSDGRRVGRLDPVFKNDLSISEAQIVQISLNEVLVKVVPESGFSDRSKKELANRIRERMGDIAVSFEELSEIPRTARGKFKAVVCELSGEERARVGN